MQLRNRFYLSDIAEPKAKLLIAKQRTSLIKPLWILPRSWCVTTSVPAKGVPRHKTATFVQLHLNRLAPFPDSGVYAIRSGDWVHLWFWENRKVREICEKFGLEFSGLELAPESVCFPMQREGSFLYPCQHGYEAQLWHNGLLVDNAWWPEKVDANAWASWRPTSAAVSGARAESGSWSESVPSHVTPAEVSPKGELVRLAEPWSKNILGRQWWHALKGVQRGALFFLAGILITGSAAYLGSQWWTIQSLQKETDAEIALLSQQVDPLNEARGKALATQQWVSQLASLRKSDQLSKALSSLQPVLQTQDAAIRELEYQNDDLRLTIVPINTELDVAAVTQEIEKNPLFGNVKLLPESDAKSIKISAKIFDAAMDRRRFTSKDGHQVIAPMANPVQPASSAVSTNSQKKGE